MTTLLRNYRTSVLRTGVLRQEVFRNAGKKAVVTSFPRVPAASRFRFSVAYFANEDSIQTDAVSWKTEYEVALRDVANYLGVA